MKKQRSTSSIQLSAFLLCLLAASVCGAVTEQVDVVLAEEAP